MKMKSLLGAVTYVLCVLFGLQNAFAQDTLTVTVNAGQKRELTSSAQPIAVTEPAPDRRRGTIETTQSGAGDAVRYALVYTAPEAVSEFTETIKYTNPMEHTVVVTVVPRKDDVYNAAFRTLFIAFVIAVLLESGLAVLFNWRPFLVVFDGRGVRAPISFAIAFLLLRGFDLDLLTRLVNVYSQRTPPFDDSFFGYVISALVIAGGSAAVNNVLVALGFRSVRSADDVRPKPPKTEGWISVTLVRDQVQGPVQVLIGPKDAPRVAGTIGVGRKPNAFTKLFVRDPTRFPTVGGFALPDGTTFIVRLKGEDKDGKEKTSDFGPETIAAGAIVDITLKL